ncbi:MAG: hypothetical protein HY899_10195 [Deltaproteobacteria bacterium]|nr:hypothetical protein [Deltaproteobacteria bacterium]
MDVTISDSGFVGVEGGTVKILDSLVENNRWGVRAFRGAKLTNTVVAGSQENGVEAPIDSGRGCAGPGALLFASSVTGNATSPDCGVSKECADVRGCKRPRLDAASACETSANSSLPVSSPNWGVCSLD